MTNAPGAGPGSGFLDSVSGEPLHPAARDIWLRASAAGFGDPRRLHQAGRRSRLMLDNARASVAESLGVRPDEVTFTPSGTHACQLGLLGLVATRPQARILASAVEHSAVLHAGAWHAARGGSLETLPVDRHGRLHPETVAAVAARAADAPVVLAVQSANHEVGTTQPVDALADAHPGPVFVDACAAGGRLPLPERWDTVALSAHKWGGPGGVGVLLVRKGARWHPPFPVDDRGDERATGFEDAAGALAAAAALAAVVDDTETGARQHELIARIRATVARIPDVDVVGDPDDRLPHVVTFSVLYVDGESIVTELDRAGFAVASGSACTASSLEPSHVLAAMGALTHGNVRVSLTRETGAAEVERFLAVLPDIVARLRAEAGL